ncbi:MAG: hypothetical protein K2Y56_09420 [Methylobacterium sp.]|uniref:hypothetical protein n=1 Tax=Methylobacterium sp. TaxID=409 RepID=UPI0025EE85EF|nr:hypothetical protein [Methylobacterium sp.]MBX9931740.1 hypothetical protein [Methylobacterium sp.]
MAFRTAFPAALLGLALGGAPASAQHMALTPGGEAPAGRPAPVVERNVPPSRPRAEVLGGELPNQRTGPMRQRVVRDICIGCDR